MPVLVNPATSAAASRARPADAGKSASATTNGRAPVAASAITDDNVVRALAEGWQVAEGREHNDAWLPAHKSVFRLLVEALIRDPRDFAVFNVALAGTLAPLSALLMFAYGVGAVQVVAHAVLLAVVTRRYTLALHVSSHKPLFRAPFANAYIPVVLGPFFGQTPYTYYYHHTKMHHVTDNGLDDLSSTLLYQRDKLPHFLHYFARFFFVVWYDLTRFFIGKKQYGIAAQVLFSEIGWFTVTAYLALRVNLAATFMSLILPYMLVRFGMMQGNWVQHSFIERENPLGGGLQNSITLINCAYNRECFNDGYHASHHLNPLRHWLEHPAELVKNRRRYFEQHAIVFQDTSYDEVWLMLMMRDYGKLASKWVHVGVGKAPSQAEVAEMLKVKTRAFTRAQIEKAKRG